MTTLLGGDGRTVNGRAPGRGSRPHGRDLLTLEAWVSVARSFRLTEREREIVQSIFDDRAEASIARELGISAHTVHSHVERIYQKCRVNSRVSLVLRIVNEHLRASASASSNRAGPPV